MPAILIRLGIWVASAWGLTEIASEATENVKEMAADANATAGSALDSVKRIAMTIMIVMGSMLLISWFGFFPKKKKR